MRKFLEFAFSLPLMAALWLWLAPFVGATTADAGSPVFLACIIIGHAALATFLFQFFYVAQMLLGARLNRIKVNTALWSGQLLIPLAATLGAAYLVPGLVISFSKLAGVVLASIFCHWVLMIIVGPLRQRIDRYDTNRHITLNAWTHGAYVPVIRNGKVEDGELFIIEREKLADTEKMLKQAWDTGIVRRDWPTAEALMIEAIPRLKGCHGLRILRLQIGIQVLMQSYRAAGYKAKTKEMEQRYEALSRIYREHGPEI